VARSDGGRAQRHWGGASRCDPATDMAFPRPFEPPRRACGRGFPLSKEGSLKAESRDRNLASRIKHDGSMTRETVQVGSGNFRVEPRKERIGFLCDFAGFRQTRNQSLEPTVGVSQRLEDLPSPREDHGGRLPTGSRRWLAADSERRLRRGSGSRLDRIEFLS